MRSMASPPKASSNIALASLFAMPRASQIEHLLGIERSDRRAVPAHDVVGEDLKLRLLIHLRPRRQQNGLRLHRAIGLLRRLLDDDLPLKHADRVVVDDRAIEFAARPAAARRGRPAASCRRAGRRRSSASPPSDALASSPVILTKICRRVSSPPETRPKAVELRALRRVRRSGFRCASPGSSPTTATCFALAPSRQRHDRRRVPLDALVSAFEHLDERRLRARPRARSPCANRPNATRPRRQDAGS